MALIAVQSPPAAMIERFDEYVDRACTTPSTGSTHAGEAGGARTPSRALRSAPCSAPSSLDTSTRSGTTSDSPRNSRSWKPPRGAAHWRRRSLRRSSAASERSPTSRSSGRSVCATPSVNSSAIRSGSAPRSMTSRQGSRAWSWRTSCSTISRSASCAWRRRVERGVRRGRPPGDRRRSRRRRPGDRRSTWHELPICEQASAWGHGLDRLGRGRARDRLRRRAHR